jgi:hypothetical protein
MPTLEESTILRWLPDFCKICARLVPAEVGAGVMVVVVVVVVIIDVGLLVMVNKRCCWWWRRC